MNKLVFVALLSLVGSVAFSQTNYLTDAYIKNINLTGLKILDTKKQDTFGYAIRPIQNPNPALIKFLADKSASLPLSRIYELNQGSSFKNIFVYIGKKADRTYELVTIYLNHQNNSSFVLDLDVLAAKVNALLLAQNPNSPEKYIGTVVPGSLFPY